MFESTMKNGIRSWLCPMRPGRCFLISIAVWPCTAILTDLLAIPLAPLTGNIDFGLAASNVTAPVCWIYGIVLWFRGFLLRRKEVGGWAIAVAVVTLPAWLLVMGVMTVLLFPLGRISSDF
jgi:hypothetical protein